MGQTKNRSTEKFHKKKINSTNIIATNFVCEQLKISAMVLITEEEERKFNKMSFYRKT